MLSNTFSPQLLSPQTGHPSLVAANFSLEKNEVLKAHVGHRGDDESGTSPPFIPELE